MLVLGLTGSIGMGKSTVAAMFRNKGVPVFDADAEVHRLQGPGGELIDQIEAAFPGTTSAFGVNRALLGEAVFGNAEALQRLEDIVHPAVWEARQDFLWNNREFPLVVLDIPLLFEGNGWLHVDKIAVVSASPEVQRERVLARAGMTVERFESILAKQTSDQEKRARADFVIPTGVSIGETSKAVDDVIACLAGRAGG